jgi:hypothetical protein
MRVQWRFDRFRGTVGAAESSLWALYNSVTDGCTK